jgi:hypothetical protein
MYTLFILKDEFFSVHSNFWNSVGYRGEAVVLSSKANYVLIVEFPTWKLEPKIIKQRCFDQKWGRGEGGILVWFDNL